VTDWPPLLGGESALSRLEAALAAPVHAYLLVGTPGGDKRAVARVFAAELLAAAAVPEEAESHRRRAREGIHPDVSLVEPEGRTLLAGEAARIITEASRRPLELDRKVIICDRFHTATPDVAASLLKTIEEPPPATTIVLLADDVPPGHATVASRCVTIRFPAPSPEHVREWLEAAGVPPAVAARAERAVAADPARARDLVDGGNLAPRLEAWWSVPERLDGSGATAATAVDELRALIDAAAAERVEDEPADPADRAAGKRRDRRNRRVRDAELRLGFAIVAQRYREELGPAEVEPAPVERVGEAIDRLRDAAAALVRNPDEKLLLQNLLLNLPRLEPR
jgi:DNA polymerase-3 subunit delta'